MQSLRLSPHTARQLFWVTFIGTLLLKGMIAATFPMTGDEAFFYQWGVYPAWGYSDHPPMVGWLLAALRVMGDSPLALRSFTVLVTSGIGLLIVDLLRRWLSDEHEASAWLAGAVYLAMPWSWMFVLVTTDTPLVFFMALSAWCYLRADQARHGAWRWYAAAGLLVGLAFLSKYFAALLGIAYAVHLLGWRRERAWAVPLMGLLALPSVLLNLAFNAWHGWPNILFNFYNRNEGSHWQLESFAVYVGMALYLITPWLLWQALKHHAPAGVPTALRRTLLVLWLFPLLVFALLGLRRTIGLHWVLGFVPLFVLWAGLHIPSRPLARSLAYTALLSLPHLVVVALIAWAPLGWWADHKLYPKAVFLRETPAIVAELQRDLPTGATLMARTYSPAAALAYAHKAYVPVFGVGRHHARQDDQLVDFREYEGMPIRVFDSAEPQVSDFAPFFERVHISRFEVAGVPYWKVDGFGFNFATYRSQVLAEVVREFHQVPSWLPLWGSPFCERYGFAECSPGRESVPRP